MRYRIPFCIAASFIFTFSMSSQGQETERVYRGAEAQLKVAGAEMIRFTEKSSLPAFIDFKPSSAPALISEAGIIMKNILGLDDSYSFKVSNQLKDEIGYTHIRYQQYYKNVPIEGGTYIAHIKNDRIQCMNGEAMIVTESAVTRAALSESEALNKALAHVGAKKYMWQETERMNELKKAFDDPDFNFDPKGSLVFFPVTSDLTREAPLTLAYKFDIYASEPESRAEIFVDAKTGAIINQFDLIHTGDVQGTAETRYCGKQTITTNQVSSTQYQLSETGRGKGIVTYNAKQGSAGGTTHFTDTDNIWNNKNAAMDDAATDAHFASEVTYDYYKNVHNRNSIDNAGFKLINYVHVNKNWFNASWNGSYMQYGDGNGNPLTAMDVGGHEVSHGLTSKTAKLVYSYESGALNESFSDIFGTAIEFYGTPSQGDFLIGEDMGTELRNMKEPNAKNHPDTYKGTKWHTASSDNGGVHINSGVQNHWFYILCEGKAGTNDINEKFDVQGIGMDKAAKIAFRNLTVYLTANSKYADARTYAMKAASDLYGNCSPEHIATTNAWHAVGVGAKSTCPVSVLVPVADFTARATVSCDGKVEFTDKSTNTPTSWKWEFGDGNTSTDKDPSHTYTANGVYTVKLTATNSGGKDDETKNAYITVSFPVTPTITGNSNVLTSSDAASYQWSFNGAIISGATGKTYTSSKEGSYTVTTTDINGCTATSAPFLITAIDPLSLNERFNVYPNPASGEITVEAAFNVATPVQLSLSNIIGEQVYTFTNDQANTFKKSVDLSKLPSGIYFMRVRAGSEDFTRKIIKQ